MKKTDEYWIERGKQHTAALKKSFSILYRNIYNDIWKKISIRYIGKHIK